MTMRRRTISMAAKAGVAALLVLVLELIVDRAEVLLPLAMLGWLIALAALRPAVIRHRQPRIALVAAMLAIAAYADQPNLLAFCLFLTATGLAATLPRRRFDDAASWAVRLGRLALAAVVGPWRDRRRLAHIRAHRLHPRVTAVAVAAALIVPLGGALLFLILFATANPLIARALDSMILPDIRTVIWRTAFALAVLLPVWATLRPAAGATRWQAPGGQTVPPLLRPGTLILSLATFNAVFAIQNGLDLVFLWSGAALPDGVTMADYAHQGAYALIVTALLAAVFVLTMLSPGSASAAHPPIRWLVTAWIGQNVLLVASSALRLIDYVDAYGLTPLRLAALIWMALVATGLMLILWRLLGRRSAAWLINANALALTLVLAACSVVDLSAVAADWNARVALAKGRSGPPLDLAYFEQLGPGALVPLAMLERHAGSPRLHDRIAYTRYWMQTGMEEGQSSWNGWSPRNARRLAAAKALLADRGSGAAPPARRLTGAQQP